MIEIRIYDSSFNWLGATQMAESVQFQRELYGAGKFEIHISAKASGAQLFCKRDNIIVLNGDGYKSGIIRDFRFEGTRGYEKLIVNGLTGDGFLERRIIVPPAASEKLGWDRVTGNAEYVIKHYVKKHITEPDDSKRKIERIFIADNKGRGKQFSWQARYTQLSEELKDIGSYGEMGYCFFADIAEKRWIFDVIPGESRVKADDNIYTHDPVLFKMGYQNIDNYSYIEEYSNYKSTGYAGGRGEDENRLIYILGAEKKGLDRFETFLDCGSAEHIDELIFYGGQKLSANKEGKSVEADALPRVFEFEKDYFLGDTVSLEIESIGISTDARITSVKEVWERAFGHKTEIRFGEKLPNVFTVFKSGDVVR